MRLPPYTSPLARAWHYLFLLLCGCVFFFLVAPVLVVVPLSFNADTYFTFSEAMLRLDPRGLFLYSGIEVYCKTPTAQIPRRPPG